eukprot:1158538-Rhodomonas_salina.1
MVFIFQIRLSKIPSAVFEMRETRPNFFQTFGYFISGYALSWGVEDFDEDKVKEQAIQAREE